jgi:2-polyprenyl-3-methyl-5-hydroxy-6-metoxy-1,4-benzoquinol methylase
MTGSLDAAARRFFDKTDNRGHSERGATTDPLGAVHAGLASGRGLAQRSLDLVEGDGLRVLDVGCSWGPITIATAESDRVARVIGLDLEHEALALGDAVLASRPGLSNKLDFVCAPAEQLPFAAGQFDLVICHTVIEHVADVEVALLEMLRVLRPGGVLHLEAPNYLWPREPHLALWMPPLGPKWLVRGLARLTGKNAGFVDHLKFVNPYWIERVLRRTGIRYDNVYLRKLDRIVVQQQFDDLVGMRGAIPYIRVIQRLQAGSAMVWLASRLGVYPSIEYAIYK